MPDQNGFQTITTTDHRAWLWVVSLLSLAYSLLCLGARLTGKWDMLFYDDAILGAGYVFAIAHYGTLFNAISSGLGASTSIISSSRITTAAEYYFTARLLAFIALCLSKLSVLVFTRRIFSGDLYKEKVFFAIAYTLAIVYGLCGVLLSSAGCRPKQSLVPEVNAVCDANIARWAVITALDVVTEIIIVALPMWFISKNQIKASKKRVVVFVFSFRLISAAFSIATMATYFNFLNGGRTSIGAGPTIAWQEVLLGFSLISASIPCLRSFLWAFMSTGLMTMYGNETTAGSKSGSMHLNSHRSQNQSAIMSQNRDNAQPSRSLGNRLRPDWLEYKVGVTSQQRQGRKSAVKNANVENGSVKSGSSEQMIIHHTTEFEIERS